MPPKRSRGIKSSSRNEGVREYRSVDEPTDRFISISFRYFVDSDDVGQSIKTWAADGSLEDLLCKLTYLTKNGITKVLSDGMFTNYTRFPDSSVNDFRCPSNLTKDEDWGVIKNIGGQKRRVAGFLRDNIFYVVFLDRDHRFWKTKKS